MMCTKQTEGEMCFIYKEPSEKTWSEYYRNMIYFELLTYTVFLLRQEQISCL
jgi:hypothetical protein